MSASLFLRPQHDAARRASRDFAIGLLRRAEAVCLGNRRRAVIAGDYRAAPIAETCKLSEAREAYRKVAAGSAGRIVLRPQE